MIRTVLPLLLLLSTLPSPSYSQNSDGNIPSLIPWDGFNATITIPKELDYVNVSLFNTNLTVHNADIGLKYDPITKTPKAVLYPRSSNIIFNGSSYYYDPLIESSITISTDFPFIGEYIFFPNAVSVKSWEDELKKRNNTIVDGWNVLVTNIHFGYYPIYKETRTRGDGSVIILDISMVTHAPTLKLMTGPIVNISKPDEYLMIKFDNTYQSNPLPLTNQEIPLTEVYANDPLMMIRDGSVILILILLTFRVLNNRKNNKPDEYEEKVKEIYNS